MSADNFVEIRKFKDGWRWAVGWDSSDGTGPIPLDRFQYGPFETDDAAEENAEEILGFIEYGISCVGDENENEFNDWSDLATEKGSEKQPPLGDNK
jgi:hypothetical protein